MSQKYKLPCNQALLSLEKADRRVSYSGFDIVRYSCQISTEKGQIALTNGELLKQWDESNRSYFIYKPLIPVSNELVITSGKYKIKKEQYKGINLEVYYYEKHHFNLDRIIRGFKKSIDLNSIYSIYPHKTLKIVETPAYMEYAAARAYPGMYVWNENSGFTSIVNEKKDNDQVFAISAHEMAHHWWGYELLPAEAEGLSFLVESMAEFMCTLATEKEYGKEKALQYVKDSRIRYLKLRGKAKEDEVSLSRVHHNQSYLAYQKGMIQLYTLKEYIGEKALTQGLKQFYDQYSLAGKDRFSQKEKIYPVTTDMIQALTDVCPDSLSYLINDLFNDIVFYDFKAEKATVKQLSQNHYQYHINFSLSKLRADGQGKESKVECNDYVKICLLNKKGERIYEKFHRLTHNDKQVIINSSYLAETAVLDPDGLLLDKDDKNNKIQVK